MANVPTISYDETKPAGTRDINLGDDDIRELKTQIREILAADHEFLSSGQGANWGHHNIITLLVQTSITALADAGKLYTKDVGGKAELHFKDEAGNEKQITTAGKFNVEATEAVLLTGVQTIAGVKTFSDFPITPSLAPTTNYQVANKKYVDDSVPTLPALGAWVDKSAAYGAQQAATDGFVIIDGTQGGMAAYTDSAANPTTIRGDINISAGMKGTITMPVKKNDYWKLVVSGGSVNSVYWIPLS